MKPTTLEEALTLVPTHWPLQCGEPLQTGDETLEFTNADYGEWESDVYPHGHGVGGFTHARRPIPQDVRESAAWWLLYNTLATVSPESDGVTLQVSDDPREKWMPLSLWKHYATKTSTGMRKFENNVEADKCIVALGGEHRIIKELSIGTDPLGRWILAGKP